MIMLDVLKLGKMLAVVRFLDSVLASRYSKIPKISTGSYIFQRPFLRGLFLEGLVYGGKFAFQHRLG